MSLITEKGRTYQGVPILLLHKNEEKYMYPGPIRNQAFDILFLFEATAVAFRQFILPPLNGDDIEL